jgi:uncharacterized protein
MPESVNPIEDFLSQAALAVAGVSRGGKKFGNRVFRDLKAKGYRVYPINPCADEVEGERSYPDLAALPEKVGGVISVVPPGETEKLVGQAVSAGIGRVWMQPGAESVEAIARCHQAGISAIVDECIMTFPAHLSRNP